MDRTSESDRGAALDPSVTGASHARKSVSTGLAGIAFGQLRTRPTKNWLLELAPEAA